MKKTQKLKATVEDISFETTFDKLPKQFHQLVKQLEENPQQSAHCINITSGNASLFIELDFIGTRPKAKVKLFGHDQDEFLKRQYKTAP